MNIFQNNTPPPKHDPAELLKQAENLLNKSERRQGWPYYDLKHALQFAQMVLKLSKIPTKKASINSLTLRQQTQTLRARLTQGKAFIVDKGYDVVKEYFDAEELAILRELTEKVQISVRKVNLIVEVVEPVDNILDAMTAIVGEVPSEDGEFQPFNEDAFRAELIDFINNGEVNSQASWENYTPTAEKYARQLAMQDNTIIVECNANVLIVMKMSEEMLKGLE
jgi:hypothetical protein